MEKICYWLLLECVVYVSVTNKVNYIPRMVTGIFIFPVPYMAKHLRGKTFTVSIQNTVLFNAHMQTLDYVELDRKGTKKTCIYEGTE